MAEIRFNPKIQTIMRYWNVQRNVEHATEIDLSDETHILTIFKRIKPILLETFYKEFENEPKTAYMFKLWLGQKAIAFGNMNDIVSRNIWIDLRECFILLWENNLIDIDDKRLKINSTKKRTT
mgnify:CR=1 FL=1